MKKKAFCYILHIGYEEFLIKQTLKSAILEKRKDFDDAYSHYKDFGIEVQYDDDSREDVDLRPFIIKVSITEEKIKEIENKIDKQIDNTEMLIRDFIKGKGMITGYFGITRDRRESVIEEEIKRAGYIWDEEKITN